jgi:outer membrane protein OmpA-like peptidoglycan-associated protein
MRYTLAGVSVLTLLSGCGWFDSDTPSNSAKVRPGADRLVPASGSLPSAGAARQYEAAIAPVDETRNGPKIGSLVPDKGGQKKQLEAVAKEAAEHDKQARETREKAAQETAERQAKESRKSQEPTQSAELPTQPLAPPRAPVTSTPGSPPYEPPVPQSAAPPPSPPQVQTATPPSAISTAPTPEAVASPPSLPVDPNKAFSPPPGWAPPSQAQPDGASQETATSTKMPEVPATPFSPPSEPAGQTAAIPTSTPPAVTAIAPVPVNPNKAFEPPPGWVPPGQTASAPSPTAPSPPTAAALVSAPRPTLTPASPLPARLANSNTAAEPTVAEAAPLPPQTSTAAPSPVPPPPVAEPIMAHRADPDGAFGTPDEQGAPEAALSATRPTRSAAASSPASPVPVAPSPSGNMASMAARPRAPNPASPPPVAALFFARQSADITDEGKAELARLAKTLKNARQLELHGYAGDGDPVDDRRVALARALAVRSHLIDLGVTAKMDLIIATLPRRSAITTEHVDIVIPSE